MIDDLISELKRLRKIHGNMPIVVETGRGFRAAHKSIDLDEAGVSFGHGGYSVRTTDKPGIPLLVIR